MPAVVCKFMSSSANLLDRWFDNAKMLSSPIAIKQVVARDRVDFIYITLSSYFPKSFFDVELYSDRPSEKASWILSLLSNYNHIGSISALNEIATLIEYSQGLGSEIRQEFESLKRNPQNLRSFFFELYIYHLLDRNGIKNSKKVKIGKQIVEGVIYDQEKEYLFECKKVFMPMVGEFDILRRLLIDFKRFSGKMKGGTGIICTIKLTRPVSGKHRSYFERIIKEYFLRINKKGVNAVQYCIDSEFGSFYATHYDEATFVETKDLKLYDMIFYLIPPKSPMENQINYYSGKSICNFSYTYSEIYDKLKKVLKQKKAQHKYSLIKDKIIFIDNEIIPEFYMSLFQRENMLDEELLRNVYEDLNLSESVCILRRDYTGDNPSVKSLMMYKDSSASGLLNKIFT